jgi:hypothetical protein
VRGIETLYAALRKTYFPRIAIKKSNSFPVLINAFHACIDPPQTPHRTA